MDAPLLTREWYCPRCPAAARTGDQKTPMHPCPGLAGLMSPLVRQGVRAKTETVERGDYVGRELVQTDTGGRPVMAVLTTRDDGQDCTVYAPTAQGHRG